MRKTARALPQYLRMHGKLRNDVEYVFQSNGVFSLHKFPTAGALLWQNPLQIEPQDSSKKCILVMAEQQ